MHPNEQLLETFYSAFARLDPDTMAQCHAPAAAAGQAHWEAHDRFSATGRRVHNVIDGGFTFTPQGRIATPSDRFDFWAWARRKQGGH